MKVDDLLDAIGKIDAHYVKEAEDSSDYGISPKGQEQKDGKRSGRWNWFRKNPLLGAAACLALFLVGGSAFFLMTFRCGSSASDESGMEEYAAYSAAEDVMEAAGATEETDRETDSADGEQTQTTADSAAAEEIHINVVSEVLGVEICMAEPDSTKEMTIAEAEEYYGVSLIPENLPQGVSMAKQQTLSVGYTVDGTVMDDNNQLEFLDEDGTLRLKVSARTTESGSITEFASDSLEKSVMGDTEFTIGYDASGDGYYLAICEKAGTTVTVEGYGISQEDMLAVLRSLFTEN